MWMRFMRPVSRPCDAFQSRDMGVVRASRFSFPFRSLLQSRPLSKFCLRLTPVILIRACTKIYV